MAVGSAAFSADFAAELSILRERERTAGLVGRRYVDDVLGFAFELPAGWVVLDPGKVARAAEGRLLTSHEEAMNDAFRSLAETFRVVVAVSAPTWDDPVARIGPHEIGPCAVLHLEELIPADACDGFDLWDHVATDLAHFHAHIEDYRLLEQPRRTTLSGCDAVAYAAAYTVLHADAVEGCPARERTYYVRHGPAVLALRLGDYPERHARLAHDFQPLVSSVRFR